MSACRNQWRTSKTLWCHSWSGVRTMLKSSSRVITRRPAGCTSHSLILHFAWGGKNKTDIAVFLAFYSCQRLLYLQCLQLALSDKCYDKLSTDTSRKAVWGGIDKLPERSTNIFFTFSSISIEILCNVSHYFYKKDLFIISNQHFYLAFCS